MHCVGLQTRPQTGVRRVRLQLNRVTPRGSVRFFFFFGITKRKETFVSPIRSVATWRTPHFVIIAFCLGVEGLQNEFRVFIRTLICHEKIVHGQPGAERVIRNMSIRVVSYAYVEWSETHE